MNDIEIEKKNSTIVITLQRERILNALNLNMVRNIYSQINNWELDESVCGVLIKGAGEKAFCAGGDIVSVYHAKNDKENNISDIFFREEYLLNYAISKFKKPWISILNGIAMGGGLGLSVHGSHRIITEKTITAMPETAIGLFPDVGGGFFLSRMKGCIGKYIAITGNVMDFQDTIYSGIGTNLILYNNINKFINDICLKKKYDYEDVDKLIKKYEEKNNIFPKLKEELENINHFFSFDTMKNIYEALKRDGSEWSKKILKILNRKSPTSMAVSLVQIEKSKKLTLKDCLAMEFRICQSMMAKHDFYEGVRANLVDKDREPKWSPSNIQSITDQIINEHFNHLGDKELF